MNYIESKDNSFFKNIKKLKEKKNRVKEGKFLLEGLRLVEEAIKAEAKIETIIIDEKVKDKIIFSGNYADVSNYLENIK